MNKKYKINFSIKTKKGRKRTINQDSLLCGYDKHNNFIAIICDGISSVNGSEFISKFVCNFFLDNFINSSNSISKIHVWFKQTLSNLQNKLKKMSIDKKLSNISTTLAMLIICNNQYFCINIGDTRIYKIQRNKIEQCTYDFNYKNYLIANKCSKIVIEKNESKWKALTSYIDISNPNVAKFKFNQGTIYKKDIFLICSDGLYSFTNEKIIVKILNNKFLSLSAKNLFLFKNALKNRSNDDISSIIVSVK